MPQKLIYTTEEGGEFKFGWTEDFGKACNDGRLPIFGGETVEPKYIAILEVVKDYDFILGRSRLKETP